MSIDLKQEILDKGYVIIDEFLNEDTILLLKQAIQNNTDKMMILKGRKSTRYLNLLGTHNVFHSILLDHDIDHIAKIILGECVNLVDFEIVSLHPGAIPLSAHSDYPFVLMDKIFYDPIASLQTLWALDDFTEENGATLIVPGSHKEQKWPDETFHERCQPLLLNKGSVVIFHGALWHGTMANKSEQDRMSMLVSFTPSWIQPLSKLDTNLDKNNIHPILADLLGYNNKQFLYKNLRLKQKNF